MKIVYWTLGLLLAVIIILGIVQSLASERIEVVELHTINEAGEPETTRLWIVDDEGLQYLRVGADGSGWYSRLSANKKFELTRKDETRTYTFKLRTDKQERINQLMQEKYTWGDSFMGALVGSREGSIPIELHPEIALP